MPVSAAYKSFIQDLLADFGPVSIRRMFSGAGVYADGVMFAILADDTLYLKADEVSARDFAAEGKGPFTYRPKDVVKSLYPIGRFPSGCSTTLKSL